MLPTPRVVIANFVPGLEDGIVEGARQRGLGLAFDIVSGTSSAEGEDVVRFDSNTIHFGDYELPDGPCRTPALDLSDLTAYLPYQPMALKCLDKLEKPTVWQRYLWRREERSQLKEIRWTHQLRFDERRRIALKHVAFWLNRIDEHNVKAVISTSIPHVTFDYALFVASRIRNIPFLTFFQVYPWSRMLPSFSAEPDFDVFGQKHDEDSSLLPELPADIAGYIASQTQAGHDPRPAYMSKKGFGFHFHTFTGMASLKRVLAALKPRAGRIYWRTALSMAAIGLEYSLRLRRQRIVYDELAISPDLSSPFVYLALHVQPELTTAPLAREFADPVAWVRLVAESLPETVRLYVKEHPAQPAISRSPEMYRELASMRNVHLVTKSTSTFDLIDHSIAVATCTGTVGWEALIRGKPVLAFGVAPFGAAEGVSRVTSRAECRAALDRAMQGRPAGTPTSTDLFLRRMVERTIPGNFEVWDLTSVKTGDATRAARDFALEWLESNMRAPASNRAPVQAERATL